MTTPIGKARGEGNCSGATQGGKEACGCVVKLTNTVVISRIFTSVARLRTETCSEAGGASGITVIDCDSPEAAAACQDAGIVSSMTQATKRGVHIVFKHNGERDTVRVNGVPGVDRRGEGGYVRAYAESAQSIDDALSVGVETEGLMTVIPSEAIKMRQPIRFLALGLLWLACGGYPCLSQQSTKAEPEPIELPSLTNSIVVELVRIPRGEFMMGSPSTEKDRESNEDQVKVTLSKDFWLGQTEVTNAQWKRVMGSVPSEWKDGDRPVEGVSWDDAMEFCRKLSELPEEKKAGRVYRLPTEAEWEYVCRAGTKAAYSFGDDESLLGDYGWFDTNSDKQTHPVGKKKANAWGLHDMHGNVWEWCSDWQGDYPNGAVTDPRGPLPGSDRGIRGGSWLNAARGCRSAIRFRHYPSVRNSAMGFRLAMSPSGAESPEAGK